MTARASARARFRGCLLGLAVGDALGTTLAFQPPGSFEPITDMVGGGPYDLQPGQWTDDTAMALCLATSLVERGGFDPHDQMRRYLRWYREGYLSSTGQCFDIGNTVRDALERFERTGEPMAGSTEAHTAGNGGLMRLAPVAMAWALQAPETSHFAAEATRTTHAAEEALDASRLFATQLRHALNGEDKHLILVGHRARVSAPAIVDIARGDVAAWQVQGIRGSGYVVDSLRAALWCFATTDSFEQAVLAAANLGDDADTTAAICGQLAGAFYGVQAIPEGWRERIVQAELINQLTEQLYQQALLG